MTANRYLAFGLRVQTDRAIPSFAVAAAPFAGKADVEIVDGIVTVPASARVVDGIKIHVDGESVFLDIEECGRFELFGGRRIVVDPAPDATADQVNLYVAGSVFGILLHQRGVLPFHCNAVEIEGSAFLFCGDSGAGKSTLAAHFVERGFRLLADDVCALDFATDDRVMAAPGAARLKLWQDTLDAFGRSSAGLPLVPWYEDKFEVSLNGQARHQPLPVGGLYHLRKAGGDRPPGIYPLKGLAAANSVTANIYRRTLGGLVGAAPGHLEATARIIEQVPVFTLNRNWGFENFQEEVLAVEDHMRKLARGLSPRPGGFDSGRLGSTARA